jgi:hypothetical protein
MLLLQDVGVVSAYVQGVIISYGIDGSQQRAVSELRRFLFDAAPQFWHELCAFAHSRLTVQVH